MYPFTFSSRKKKRNNKYEVKKDDYIKRKENFICKKVTPSGRDDTTVMNAFKCFIVN